MSEYQTKSVFQILKGVTTMAAKLVEYLTTTRLGERGTMTLPKEYRRALKLETGAPLTVLRIGDGLILVPEQKRFDQLCNSIATRLENADITESSLQATLPEVRERLVKRRYPELFRQAISKPVRSRKAAKGRKRA
jgi:AbrB family looped-hinge helix DNA binding protein